MRLQYCQLLRSTHFTHNLQCTKAQDYFPASAFDLIRERCCDVTQPKWQPLPFLLLFLIPPPIPRAPSFLLSSLLPSVLPPSICLHFLSPALPPSCSWMWSPPCGQVTSVSWSWGSWSERSEGGCSEGSCGEVECQVGGGATTRRGGDDGSLWHLRIWYKQLSSPVQSCILRTSGSELCIVIWNAESTCSCICIHLIGFWCLQFCMQFISVVFFKLLLNLVTLPSMLILGISPCYWSSLLL